MRIDFNKTERTGAKRTIWREPKVLPGGFTPTNNPPNGSFIKRGTLVLVDTKSREATIIRVAKVMAIDSTHIRISNDGLMKEGITCMISGKGTSFQIVSIDKYDNETDIITIDISVESLAVGDIFFEVKPKGMGSSEIIYPNAVTATDCTVKENTFTVLDIAWQAIVVRSATNGIPDEFVCGGITLKNNHNIVFIN